MKKFSGILICTDLDGTLLRNDSSISKENIDAIEYFKEEGGLFTFVTGRLPYYVKGLCDIVVPNVPYGCCNGGALYDHKKQEYLWKRPLSYDAMELIDYILEQVPEAGVVVCGFERTYFCHDNSAIDEFVARTGIEKIMADRKDVTGEIAKIIFCDMNSENIRRIGELLYAHPKVCDFDFVRSERFLFEVMPKDTHKGTVIEKMSEILGIDIDRTIAIGDYDNDIGMLKSAKLGIAVENAVDSVKAVADMVTVSNQNHAIAKIIEDLDTGKIVL